MIYCYWNQTKGSSVSDIVFIGFTWFCAMIWHFITIGRREGERLQKATWRKESQIWETVISFAPNFGWCPGYRLLNSTNHSFEEKQLVHDSINKMEDSATKLFPRIIELWFVLWSFFLLMLLFFSINLQFDLTWSNVVISELVLPFATGIWWISYRNRCVGLIVFHLLLLVNPRLIV